MTHIPIVVNSATSHSPPELPGLNASAALVAALALASSATSLGNGFAFDDIAIIVTNEGVHRLAAWWRLFASSYWPPSLGGSLYRPFTTLAFALQWSIGGGAPLAFHIVSVLLYMAVCVGVWRLFQGLMPRQGALVAAALFAVHPVHVESVGNVIGQAELLPALTVVAGCSRYLQWRRHGPLRGRHVFEIVVWYVAGALFKEHALLFPALLIALEALVIHDSRPVRERANAMLPLLIALLLAGTTILFARVAVVGSLIGEKQVVEMDVPTRVWMMFRVVPEWVRLFLWPAHLSAYYGPHDIEIVRGPTLLRAAGIAIVVVSVLAMIRAWRANPLVAFAIAWLGITLFPASNLLSGFILEEHTLFLPSVGAMMLLGAGWNRLWRQFVVPERTGTSGVRRGESTARIAGVVVVALVAAGTVRSAVRQPVWKDNVSLFAATVLDAPLSYRAHYLYGTTLFELGRNREGERELKRAIELSVNDSDPYNYLATKYREAKLYQLAIPLYRQAVALNGRRPDARFGLAYALLETGDVAAARAQADTGLSQGQLLSYFRWIRARADSVLSLTGTPPSTQRQQ